MTTNDDPTTTAAAERATKRRRRKALLASGAVLGVGVVITLAAWNDSVWGNAMFGTGENSWNVEASFDRGGTWAEFVTEDDSGTMQFNLDSQADPAALMPGDSVTEIVGLRETERNMDSKIIVRAPKVNANTLAQALTVKIEDLGALQSGNGRPILAETSLAGGQDSAEITLPKGGETFLRFTVTLPNGTQPSKLAKTVDAAWQITAESLDK